MKIENIVRRSGIVDNNSLKIIQKQQRGCHQLSKKLQIFVIYSKKRRDLLRKGHNGLSSGIMKHFYQISFAIVLEVEIVFFNKRGPP